MEINNEIEKIKAVEKKVEPFIYRMLNETFFSAFLMVMTSVYMYLTLKLGLQDQQVISFLYFKCASYFFLGTTFIKFYNGIGYDINKEIFLENNTAAANMLGMFWIGLGICISLGNLG